MVKVTSEPTIYPRTQKVLDELVKKFGADIFSYDAWIYECEQAKAVQAVIATQALLHQDNSDLDLIEFFFTFGFGWKLQNCYTTVYAEDSDAARMIMVSVYKDAWGFQYDNADDAGIEKYPVKYVEFGTPNWRL